MELKASMTVRDLRDEKDVATKATTKTKKDAVIVQRMVEGYFVTLETIKEDEPNLFSLEIKLDKNNRQLTKGYQVSLFDFDQGKFIDNLYLREKNTFSIKDGDYCLRFFKNHELLFDLEYALEAPEEV